MPRSPYDDADKGAIVILTKALGEVEKTYPVIHPARRFYASWLINAIRHLAYPDRDLYPKIRTGRKTDRRRNYGPSSL